MESAIDQRPIYDERVNYILRSMVEGKTRDEIAIDLGHKNYKTLDIYMRRKNFSWDRNKQTYVPLSTFSRMERDQHNQTILSSTSKVATIISLFNKEGADAKTIAKRLGFTDHRELASYMKAKGYKWSSEAGNYERVLGQLADDGKPVAFTEDRMKPESPKDSSPAYAPTSINRLDAAQIEQFLPLLEMLDKNKDRLVDLIVPGAESGKVPRFTVPGIFITKSVHMSNLLDQMVREYSKEKNISQRDIFTVALIEFFRRYGYEREIETLMGKA